MDSALSQIDTDVDAGEGESSSARGCGHSLIAVTSVRATQFVDITDRVNALVAASRVSQGIVNIQTLHTTTAIVLNEHEPLLLADFEALLSRVAPTDSRYRHDDPHVRVVNLTPDERTNGHAHCRALFLTPSLCLNVAGGQLVLGRWQRLFFVELDGPRERLVSTLVLGGGEAGR